jgi:MerR family copper efflux transcriptional regulator
MARSPTTTSNQAERGLLPAPERRANGYRDYSQETINRLSFIRRGQDAGLTLAQIADILRLRAAGEAPCDHVRELLARQLSDLDRKIEELIALRATVAGFHRNVIGADPASCDREQICSFL